LSRLSTKSLIKNISPRSAAAFGVGFVLSMSIIVITAIATFTERGIFRPGESIVLIVLSANAVLILGLAFVVGVRLFRRIRGRRFGEPAPRLHLRFVALFSIAAAAPAILSAIFLGAILSRGVDYWFGERVTTLVDGVSKVATDIYEREASEAWSQLEAMAYDLNQEGPVEAFTTSRIQYVQYLSAQTAGRNFTAAYVIDRQGTVLARSEFRENEIYVTPSARLFELAENGDPAVTTPEQAVSGTDVMHILFKLDAYQDSYLYASQQLDLDLFRQMEDARTALREAGDGESEIRNAFYMLYLEIAALLLVGATWLALSAATRVVTPISRLVSAAERVRRGDLDARVQMTREDDEITALGRAFNRMTRQLRSQRRELIESHAESEQRRALTEAVLSGVSAGVIGLDSADNVTLINRSAVSLLGPETVELNGVKIDDVAEELSDIVKQARRHPGIVADSQIDLHSADEQVRHLNARAIMDEEAGLVITFDDITRLVTAQRNSAWRDVARRIAHEIKNPLTPIQLSAERLKRKYRKEIHTDVETFDRCTETIVRQVSDIGRMVDEFSSFARMPQPKVEEVEMGEMVQAAVFSRRVATPSIEILYQRPTDDVTGLCDERLSSQALDNILKNASESVISRVESGADKNAPGQIKVQLSEENGFVVIEVSDNGLGWPTANRERLTEPYMTTREKGTGLGLAIVKRVMEDHKGRLELGVPQSGKGAVVRLVFPIQDIENQIFEQEKEA